MFMVDGNCKISRLVVLSIFLIYAIRPGNAEARTYKSKDCPVTFNVPSDLELRDVIG